MATIRRLWPAALGLMVLAGLTTISLTSRTQSAEPLRAHDPAPSPPRDGDRIRYPAGHYPALPLPGGRSEQVRSILDIAHPMQFGDYVWNDAGIGEGPVWVRVDLSRQMLSVFRAGHEIGTAVILYGTDGKPTPTGLFPILARAKSHHSSLYEAEMPYMLRLTGDGVAIHASHVRQGFATHGCIGIPIDFAAKLYDAVHVGDRVAILPPET